MNLLVTEQYIEDWEFHIRLGITREQMALVCSCFPETDLARDEEIALASIHEGLNEVANGVHIPEEEWRKWFSVPKAQVKNVLRKWQSLEDQL
jgi:hypothetical protein